MATPSETALPPNQSNSPNQSLPPSQSLPPNPPGHPNEAPSDAQQSTQTPDLTSSLDTLKGPPPSLEAFANYNPLAPPTVLRSERRQAGKAEYLTSCAKLEEILGQALGLSQSIPVPPATIISGLRDIQEQCRKRKRDVSEGKPIPPEDLIDLTTENNDEEHPAGITHGTSSPKQPPKQTSAPKHAPKRQRAQAEKSQLQHGNEDSLASEASKHPSVSNGQNITNHPNDDDDPQSPTRQITPPTLLGEPAACPEPAVSLNSAAPNSTGAGLAITSSLANSTAGTATVAPNPSVQNLAAPPAAPAPAAPSLSQSGVAPNLAASHATSQAVPTSSAPGNATNQPTSNAPPPAPMIMLRTSTTEDSRASGTKPANQNSSPATSTPRLGAITSILNDSIRADVHDILKNFQGYLNRQKFKQAHQSVHAFIDSRVKMAQKRPPPAALPQFSLDQSDATHNVWLKDIQKYLESMLLPAHTEPWFAPHMISISNLKSSDLAQLKATSHLEYPLVLLLLEIQQPNKVYLSRWANCIASSIKLSAQQFAIRPPSLTNLSNDNLDSHLRILEFLNGCKTNALGPNAEEGKPRNDMSLKPLYQLHDLIIDMFITYSIIRGSAAADVEVNETSSESQALVAQKKELDKHRSRHNYTPFCLYLVAGVRGLILSPYNRQFASGASALGFLSAVEYIFQKNTPRREASETIWKRLGAYIDGLFIASFLTPDCLFNFRQPEIIQLAQAITADFLGCLQHNFPEDKFQLPRAITSK